MSVNWADWPHSKIYSMLQTSVDLRDIGDGVEAWDGQRKGVGDVLTKLAPDLNEIVSGGWRGVAADKAISILGPIDEWSASVAETTKRITALMDASGSSVAQAKAAVPSPKSFDWGELRRSVTTGGLVGGIGDLVAQERAQDEAHAEAVRIMTDVYSAPINEYSAAVPAYSQLVDPTLPQPEQPPMPGPAPAPHHPDERVPGGGSSTRGGGGTHGHSVQGAGTHGGAVPGVRASTDAGERVAHSPPVPVGLQNVTSDRAGLAAHGGQVAPDQAIQQPEHAAGEAAATTLAAAAAGVPVIAPIAGDEFRKARAAGGSHLGVGGYVSGDVRADVGHFGEFGPRPTSPATEITHPQGTNPSGREAGRAEAGEMMAPMGGGRGPGGEDSEHRRPSYLIEMNDVFSDGRKVAPAVIGEDLPEQDD